MREKWKTAKEDMRDGMGTRSIIMGGNRKKNNGRKVGESKRE